MWVRWWCRGVHHVWVLGAQGFGGAVGAAAHLGLCINGEEWSRIWR